MKYIELLNSMKFEHNNFNSFKSILKAVFITGNKNAVFLIRLFQICHVLNMSVMKYLVQGRLIKKYGIFISSNTIIGKGLILPHPNGIIFGDKAIIGENAIIFQQVTIGSKYVGDKGDVKYPIIGDNCILAAGSKALGSISISNNTIVGANAVLINDTDEDSIMVGIPAKKVDV